MRKAPCKVARRACAPRTMQRRKVKTMSHLFENFRKKALAIANSRVADVVEDVDLLTVALCAGNFNEIKNTLFDAKSNETKHIAAHKALDLGFNPALRKSMAKNGFFAKGLFGLLEIAKKNPAAGSRLMPIFCAMITDDKKYAISSCLKNQVLNFMNQKRDQDGFAITGLNDSEGEASVSVVDSNILG